VYLLSHNGHACLSSRIQQRRRGWPKAVPDEPTSPHRRLLPTTPLWLFGERSNLDQVTVTLLLVPFPVIISNTMSAETLQDKAARVIAVRDAQFSSEYRYAPSYPIPLNVSNLYRTSGFLTDRQIEIVSHDGVSLAEAIARRRYTSVEVTEAFCRAAALAQETTNCLAWFAPKEALGAARALDQEMERTSKPVGPLHGVPISIKGASDPEGLSFLTILDFINVKGYPQSAGHIASAELVPEQDAHIVAVLRRAGAGEYIVALSLSLSQGSAKPD
jgi:hypothetical protein